MNPINVIGIAGYARCGKDTFVGIARNILTERGFTPVRIAFADTLKEEVESMLRQNKFACTIYDETPEGKTFNRPLLVWWGCKRRHESPDGLYWVKQAEEKIKSIYYPYPNKDKLVFLVSDVRFPNESKWIHESFNGKVIHLRRWKYENVCGDGVEKCMMWGDGVEKYKMYDPAPNEEENKNDPLVKNAADYKVEWENKGSLTSEEAIKNPYLQGIVRDTLKSIGLIT